MSLHGHLALAQFLYTLCTGALPLSHHSSAKGASILKTGTVTEKELQSTAWHAEGFVCFVFLHTVDAFGVLPPSFYCCFLFQLVIKF